MISDKLTDMGTQSNHIVLAGYGKETGNEAIYYVHLHLNSHYRVAMAREAAQKATASIRSIFSNTRTPKASKPSNSLTFPDTPDVLRYVYMLLYKVFYSNPVDYWEDS